VLLFSLVKCSVILGKEVQSKVDRFQIDMPIVVDPLHYMYELRSCRKDGAWLLSCFDLRTFGQVLI
jgi:hypothetical protein